jgi:hypothetical protein
MKQITHLLLILLFQCQLCAEGKEESKGLSILEALEIAIESVPEGAEVTSIERLEMWKGQIAYYAIYGEKIFDSRKRELKKDGIYEMVPAYYKRRIGLTVSLKGEVDLDIREDRVSKYRFNNDGYRSLKSDQLEQK